MNNQKETIRKFVTYINNQDHLGGFWLPNIQRDFVWTEEQIQRLYDSILREYPIGTLLVWKTISQIKHRKFIDNWREDTRILDFYVPSNNKQKMLVLDGQQRMQSLYIGLKGSYNSKEMYLDVLSGEKKAPDDIRYVFKFLPPGQSFPLIKFKDLVFTDAKPREIKHKVLTGVANALTPQQEDRLEENIELIRNVFCTQENILFQELDSIDRPSVYSEDDIVEVFIRANSGGTKLDKSDLLFSLLVSSWDDANEKMTLLLEELNRDGFEFGRDFILKCCLVLFGKGAAYNVEKFRSSDTKKDIEDNWDKVCETLLDVKDFIKGRTFIQTDKTLTSYLALIPIVYFRYHYPVKWKTATRLNEYLIRVLLAGAFGGSPDNLIDRIVKKIQDKGEFDVSEVYGVIRDIGRNLELSKESLLNISYTDKRIHLIFNLWYDFNYDPSYIQNEPQLDHIFPQSALKTIKEYNPHTGRNSLMKYKQQTRDQLGNMMLLTRSENGAGGKGSTLAEDWFAGKDKSYLDLHLIPSNPVLWELDNFEQFIEERKKLILAKFDYLLIKSV